MNSKDILTIQTRSPDKEFEYNYFSILKFLFVILIAVIHHNYFNSVLLNTSTLFKFIYINGHELIYCFFMMSGILFYKIKTPKIENKEISFLIFLKNLFIKFFPLVFITTITIYLLNFSYFNRFGIDFYDCSRDPVRLIISIIFGGQAIFGQGYINNSPLWFFNILLFMYLIAFFIAKLGKKFSFIYIIFFGLGIAMLYSNIKYPFFNAHFGKGLFGFSLGYLLAILLNMSDKLSKKVQLIIKFSFLLPLIAFFVLVSLFDIHSIKYNTLLFTFLLFTPLIVLLYKVNVINRICSYKIFLVLEKISVGVYMWNYPIMLIFYLGFNNTFPPLASSGWFTFILLVVNLGFGLISVYINKIIKFLIKSFNKSN